MKLLRKFWDFLGTREERFFFQGMVFSTVMYELVMLAKGWGSFWGHIISIVTFSLLFGLNYYTLYRENRCRQCNGPVHTEKNDKDASDGTQVS